MTFPLVFSAASLGICFFSFILLRRYIRQRTGSKRILEEFEEEVNRLIAGIDESTDKNLTLLEDKSATIKALLETLDRRLATYARELERREKQEAALHVLNSGGARRSGTEGAYAPPPGRGLRSSLQVDASSPPPPPPPSPDASVEPSAADPAEASAEPAPGSPSPQPRFTRSANQVRTKAPLSEQARELRLFGFSPETIAVRLGVTVAEVNLALALSDRLPDR
jgi:hypothetical protein